MLKYKYMVNSTIDRAILILECNMTIISYNLFVIIFQMYLRCCLPRPRDLCIPESSSKNRNDASESSFVVVPLLGNLVFQEEEAIDLILHKFLPNTEVPFPVLSTTSYLCASNSLITSSSMLSIRRLVLSVQCKCALLSHFGFKFLILLFHF